MPSLFRADEHEATTPQLTPASVGNVHLAARVAATAGKLLESGAGSVRRGASDLGLAGEEEQEEGHHATSLTVTVHPGPSVKVS